METLDTIAAVASAPGRSLRAVVRLSGAEVGSILRRLLIEAPQSAGVHRVRLGLASACGAVELPCVVLVFLAPKSYTGQDAAEIQVPGNPHLVARLLDQILGLKDEHGAAMVRLAEPGEFTARAFLAGKLTSEQAEGVGAIIAAQSDAELDAANRLLDGRTGEVYRALADELTTALALVEAGIDFTDQDDVVAISPDDLAGRLGAMGETIGELLGPARADEGVGAEPRVVLVGAPNAGKSTLFNALLGRERTVVSDEPGTTRDVVSEVLDLGGGGLGGDGRHIVLVDLAGLDVAVGRWSALDEAAQAAALRAIDEADVLVVCDPSGRFELFDIDVRGRPIIRVRTKGDLPSDRESESDLMAVCALDGWNIGPLRRAIADAALGGSLGAERSRVIPRHRRALRQVGEAVDHATKVVRGSLEKRSLGDAELIADSMRTALDELGQIVGEVSPDDVIGRIFATFCVGK